MKGKYKIVIKNNRLHYEFEIKRNITIIQGDSAIYTSLYVRFILPPMITLYGTTSPSDMITSR